MLVMLDTGVLIALINKRDAHHQQATAQAHALASNAALFQIPAIARIEFLGHLTSWSSRRGSPAEDKKMRVGFLDWLAQRNWEVVSHTEEDQNVALDWWRQFADWPMQYPDLLMTATARRLATRHLWTFDAGFVRFLDHIRAGIEPIRPVAQ
jgi:predicted nucleic acid-binding protein